MKESVESVDVYCSCLYILVDFRVYFVFLMVSVVNVRLAFSGSEKFFF